MPGWEAVMACVCVCAVLECAGDGTKERAGHLRCDMTTVWCSEYSCTCTNTVVSQGNEWQLENFWHTYLLVLMKHSLLLTEYNIVETGTCS